MTDRKEPCGITCPKIDEIIKTLKGVAQDLRHTADWLEDDHVRESITNAMWEVEYLVDPVEEVRTANMLLRDWGNDLVGDINELEEEIASIT